MATNFAKQLKDIGIKRDNQIELLKEDAREKGVQIIKQFFEELFDANPKLTHVFCTGSTPEWNDGEECFHETNILIYNDIYGWSEVAEFLEINEGWHYDSENPSEELIAINKDLAMCECRDIEDQIPIDAMSEALGTDWLVKATREGIEFSVYKCGY